MNRSKEPKKAKRQTKRDIVAGLQAGHGYQRPYSCDFLWGVIHGLEKLIPIGPDFINVRHICEFSVGARNYRNEGIEYLDLEPAQLIGNPRYWTRL